MELIEDKIYGTQQVKRESEVVTSNYFEHQIIFKNHPQKTKEALKVTQGSGFPSPTSHNI